MGFIQLKVWTAHNAAPLLVHHKRNTMSSACSKQPSWLYRSLDSNWDISSADLGFASVHYSMSQMFIIGLHRRIVKCIPLDLFIWKKKSQKRTIPMSLSVTMREHTWANCLHEAFLKEQSIAEHNEAKQPANQTIKKQNKISLKKIKVLEGKLCRAQYQTV